MSKNEELEKAADEHAWRWFDKNHPSANVARIAFKEGADYAMKSEAVQKLIEALESIENESYQKHFNEELMVNHWPAWARIRARNALADFRAATKEKP